MTETEDFLALYAQHPEDFEPADVEETKVFFQEIRNTRLIKACKAGDLTAVSSALRMGADLHCYGDSPMLNAAINGHYAVVQHLWMHAPTPRVFHVGQGTLRKAAQRGYTEIVVFLGHHATPKEVVAAAAAARKAGQDATALALERFLASKNVNTVCPPHGQEDGREED